MNKKLGTIIKSVLISLTLTFNLNVIDLILKEEIGKFSYINIIILPIIFFSYMYLSKILTNKINKGKKFLSILFSLFMVLGEMYVYKGSFLFIFDSLLTIIYSVINLIGYYLLFVIIFKILDYYLSKYKTKDLKINNKIINKYLYYFDKYPFRTSFITLFIFYSVIMLAYYPLILGYDASYQIVQYFKVPTKYNEWSTQINPNVFITNHHPFLQTYLFGIFINIGSMIINDNFGLFLYNLFQTTIYIGVFAYIIKFLKENNINLKYRFILLLMYIIIPIYSYYSITAVKDTLYTSFILLFVLFLYNLITKYKDIKINILSLIKLFILMLLICLFRNNGIYVIAITFPFMLIINNNNRLRITISFISLLITYMLINIVLMPTLGISKGSSREMFSIPFQQTARLVCKYDKDISNKDKVVIDKVLRYDDLCDRYNPNLSDPVKNEYNKDTTTNELVDYFKVWFKYLFKHPLVYIDATMNNVYGFFYINAHKWYIYTDSVDVVNEYNVINYSHIKSLSWLRNIFKGYANSFPYIPIIGYLVSIGFNTCYMFVMTCYLNNKNNRKYLILLVPSYVTLLFCILGPANTYFRYTMPYVYSLPVLTVLLIDKIKGSVKYEKTK